MKQIGFILGLLLGFGGITLAQPAPEHESALGAELRLEEGRFSNSCGKFAIAGCLQTLFTDHPLHVAVGSIAPQNGFAAGLALVTHYDAKHWYVKWDADAVGSSSECVASGCLHEAHSCV
jgi:hypothetical protein